MSEPDPRTAEGGSVDTPPDKHLVLSGEGEGVLQFLDPLTPYSGVPPPGSEVSPQARAQGSQHGLQFWTPAV